jgi:hypothetical protein
MQGVQRLEKSFTVCIIPNGSVISNMHGVHGANSARRQRYLIQMCHDRLFMRNRHIEAAYPQGDRTGHRRGKPCGGHRKRQIDTVQVVVVEGKGLHQG